MTDLKTFTRNHNLRANIAANDALQGLCYEIVTTDDGKKTARFQVAQSQVAAVVDAGYEYEVMENPAPMPEAKTLDQKAMLAALSVTGWSGRITDKTATDFTLSQHQAQDGWGKFTKRLVSKDALKDIKAAEAAARKAHKELTLPWDEKGFRILPAAAWQEYSQKIGDARADWLAAVDRLIANYDDEMDNARKALGGLFDASDYPTGEELREKYDFGNEIKALDAKGDFRVQIGDTEIKRLQNDIQTQTAARLGKAMSDVYRRLHEVVAHMAERLRAYQIDDDGKKHNPFRDATLQNVEDILHIMPALNLTDDPALTELAEHVRKTLLAADAKTLREDEAKRKATADAAQEIADAMAAMM